MDRVLPINVTVPPGTLASAPITVAFPLDEATLVEVEIDVPDGHNRLTGIRLLWAGTQIIPWALNFYFIANNRVKAFAFDDRMTDSGVTIQAYNTDIFPHTFYLLATVSDVPSSAMIAAQSGSSTSVLPGVASTVVDPLSPAALMASLPADLNIATSLAAVL